MNIEAKTKINRLLALGISKGLYFSSWLKKMGYSDQLIRQYRLSGWLSMLDKGVMYRTGSDLSAYSALTCYNTQCEKQFRIAAHSALELFGYNHYVPMGKPVTMVGHPKQNIPNWMKSNLFDRSIKTFSTEIFTEPQITNIDKEGLSLLTSTAEQAFLECLLLAPVNYSYMDLFYIMEQLTALRPEVVQHLLESVKSQRVKRMFLYMAEKANHYWFEMLESSKVDLGTSKLQLVKDGVYISKYKITIPRDLYEYE